MNMRVDRWTALLVLLFLVFATINVIQIRLDKFPLFYDSSNMYLYSVNAYQHLRNSFSNFFHFISKEPGLNYPPLLMITSIPIYALLGVSEDAAQLTNTLFLGVMLFSLFGIVARFSDKKTALLASFILGMTPLVFGLSRVYVTDFALGAMTCLALYLFLKTENFRNKAYSALFGIAAGLAMLTKWSFPVYASGPIAYSLLVDFLKHNKQSLKNGFMKQMLNAALSFFISITITYFVWYRANFLRAFKELSWVLQRTEVVNYSWIYGTASKSLWKLVLFNAKMYFNFARDNLGSLLFGFFILSLGFFISIRFKKSATKGFFIIWSFLPFPSFLLISPMSNPRYLLPIIPAWAGVIALSITRIKLLGRLIPIMRKRGVINHLQKAVIAGMIILLTINFVRLNTEDIRNTYFYSHNLEGLHGVRFEKGLYFPDRRDWKEEEIIGYIFDLASKFKEPVKIILIPHYPLISRLYDQIPFRITLEKRNYEVRAVFTCFVNGYFTCGNNFRIPRDYIDGTIITGGDILVGMRNIESFIPRFPPGALNSEVINKLYRAYTNATQKSERFFQAKNFTLPDNSTIIIYANRERLKDKRK